MRRGCTKNGVISRRACRICKSRFSDLRRGTVRETPWWPWSWNLAQFPNRIQAATLQGVAPSRLTIPAGGYPVSRPLYIYVKEEHLNTTAGLADYVAEFLSSCAAGSNGYLLDEGLVPLPMPELTRQRAIAARLIQ
jgi:hypothetical protein